MYFVDTNIFLRYLTNDDPQKAARCRHLLKQAEAKQIELATNDAIIAEMVYVLSSKKQNGYALERARIRELLYPLIMIRGLMSSDRKSLHLMTVRTCCCGWIQTVVGDAATVFCWALAVVRPKIRQLSM